MRTNAPWLSAVIAAFLLVMGSAAHAATNAYDRSIVIKNGDPEYAEGGTWEAGQKPGDCYMYETDSLPCRKTSSAGSWAKWTPDLKAGRQRVCWWHNRFWWGNSGQVRIEIRHAGGAPKDPRKWETP